MNGALRKSWTLEAFLEWEEQQELRYEFDGFEAILMVGGTEAHADIQANLIGEARARLRGSACRIVGSDLKFRIGDRIRYPDAMILCSPRVPGSKLVTDPVIVFEILSPSTTGIDLMQKNAEYQSVSSVQRYVVLQQAFISAMAFVRKGDDWVVETSLGPDAMLRLPEVGVEVPMAEIYRDVVLPVPAEETQT
jgi:Uma2 family endonuclease